MAEILGFQKVFPFRKFASATVIIYSRTVPSRPLCSKMCGYDFLYSYGETETYI
jgi:hypothetical protein